MRKLISAVLSVVFVVTVMVVVHIGTVCAFSQTVHVHKDEKDWLSAGNMYVEYDYGTWRPHDDAWLKAEVYSSSYKYSRCEAWAGNKHGYDSGNYAIVEFSGVDYFDEGSYSQTSNSSGRLNLYVVE